MPKPLESPRPTSSLARLLDAGSVSRAISPPASSDARGNEPDPGHPPQPPSTRVRAETRLVKRELVLSAAADQTFGELIEALRRTTGTRLTASHAFRALMTAIRPAISEMTPQPGTSLRLPSNAPAFEQERARFETALAAVIMRAIRTR